VFLEDGAINPWFAKTIILVGSIVTSKSD